jgi:hypothetical protein
MLVLVIRLHAEQELLKPVSRKVWPPRVAVPSPELLSPTPEVAPVLIFPHSDRIGCTERRLCIRVARASYTETPKETPVITTAQTAMTVLAFISIPFQSKRLAQPPSAIHG